MKRYYSILWGFFLFVLTLNTQAQSIEVLKDFDKDYSVSVLEQYSKYFGIYELLIAEAKVSEQKQNPPSVVDKTEDSIYKTHKKYHDEVDTLKQRLVEFSKNLNGQDLIAILCVVVDIENKTNKYTITYGCGLVRDYTCVDETKDFGKMKSNANEFEPGNIHFAILSFTEETIDSTIDLFYKKVQELAK